MGDGIRTGRGAHSGVSDDIVAIARARDGSIEVATSDQTWRGNDHVLVASVLDDAEVTRRLDELVHTRFVPRVPSVT